MRPKRAFCSGATPNTVRAPDVAFVRRERVAAVGAGSGYWPGAPDLAVEVVSPGDLYTEVDEKVAMWLDGGTRMVIIVNPRRRLVTIYRLLHTISLLRADQVLDGADVVPGWSLPIHEIFAEI